MATSLTRVCFGSRGLSRAMNTLSALPRDVPDVHPPFANYSHGVIVPPGKRLLFLSGQLGITADQHVPEDAEEQAGVIFGAIKRLLAEGGMTPHDVVRINAFVTDREYLTPYMNARDRFLSSSTAEDDGSGDSAIPPASTLVVVSGFSRPEFKVEVEIVAAQNPQ